MFHLDWRGMALSQLTDAWLKADSRLRASLTAAIYDVEKRLKYSPDTAGESREPGTRVLILTPLTVTFHINVRTKTVLISGVRVSRRRK
jgi:hypothetical protein